MIPLSVLKELQEGRGGSKSIIFLGILEILEVWQQKSSKVIVHSLITYSERHAGVKNRNAVASPGHWVLKNKYLNQKAYLVMS